MRKMSLYRTTGSNEDTPICFVDGKTAHDEYGVTIRNGGPCPKCKFPVDTNLHFNPLDSYYYFHCPVCQVWLRWCQFDGTMDDLAIVSSKKTTGLDIDEDFPDHHL